MADQKDKKNNFQEKKPEDKAVQGVSESPFILSLYKKTEKLTTATYLLTDFWNDDDPLKWSLRKKSLSLFSDLVSLSQRKFSLPVSLSGSSHVLEIISMLDIAHTARMISEMNYSILRKEYEDLLKTIETRFKTNGSGQEAISFSSEFFGYLDERENNTPADKFSADFYKGQELKFPKSLSFRNFEEDKKPQEPSSLESRALYNQNHFYKRNVSQKTNPIKKTSRSKQRKEAILSHFKRGQQMSIKDISKQITDCSEKTIQRELISLVNKGVLLKQGKKRWSTYVLA